MADNQPFDPNFIEAIKVYVALSEEEKRSLKGQRLHHEILRYAPTAYKELYYQILHENGLCPKPSGYTAQGEPLFHPKDIAKHFGISEEKVIDNLIERELNGFEGTIRSAKEEVHKMH